MKCTFQSPTNRVLNSVRDMGQALQRTHQLVSIPYKSGPKFCGGLKYAHDTPSPHVSIPYKSGPKFCGRQTACFVQPGQICFNPLQIGS